MTPSFAVSPDDALGSSKAWVSQVGWVPFLAREVEVVKLTYRFKRDELAKIYANIYYKFATCLYHIVTNESI